MKPFLLALSLIVAAAGSGCATCARPPAGLVSWWPGNGNASDLVGPNQGTLQGTTTFAEGKVAQAFAFSSSEVGVRIPASPSLNVRSFTIAAWVYPNTAAWMLITDWNSGNGYGVELYLWPDVTQVTLDLVETNGVEHHFPTPPATVAINAWNHVAASYDSATGQAKIYVNGSLSAEQNVGIVVPKTDWDFNIGQAPGGCAFSGKIDEVMLFDRPLSDKEVRSFFEAGSVGMCSPKPGRAISVPPLH